MSPLDILFIALVFLAVLSVLVLVHELGHFLVARRAGIKVEEFGFGFPPRVLGKKIGETMYSVNAIPLGGFVRLHGEEGAVGTDKERAFFNKGKSTRAAVVVAGVLMNILLAILAFTAIVWIIGVPVVKITEVVPGSPAEAVGLRKDDVVYALDGERVRDVETFVQATRARGGKEINLIMLQDGLQLGVKVTPRANPPQGQGPLGVAIADFALQPSGLERPLVSFQEGVSQTWFWAKMTLQGIGGALGEAFRGHTPEGLAGPIGIAEITGKVVKLGIIPLISFVGILSVNLAILNILPFPALDGGRLLFILVETLFGRRVLPTFEKYAHMAGFILLLTLLLAVSFMDLSRILSGAGFFPQSQ